MYSGSMFIVPGSMFHGKIEVFSEGVEEGEVGVCVGSVFRLRGVTAVVCEVGVEGGRVR